MRARCDGGGSDAARSVTTPPPAADLGPLGLHPPPGDGFRRRGGRSSAHLLLRGRPRPLLSPERCRAASDNPESRVFVTRGVSLGTDLARARVS